jgi:C-terminal processing protease CtpA/Prc
MRFADWHDVYHNREIGYARLVFPNMSDEALFNVCARMLRELNDPHVGLIAPGRFVSSYGGSNEDFSLQKIRDNLTSGGINTYRNFLFDTFAEESRIGYIYIESFTNDPPDPEHHNWGKAIDNIIAALADTEAIVLDVRNNRGGDLVIMEYIAARFASSQRDYLKARMKNGPGRNDFSAPRTHTIRPVSFSYTKPIVLLTNNGTTSAAEWLTMALRTQNHVTHVGTRTCGAFSVRITRPMVNGWFYSISAERVTDMNGRVYEGIGISPDEERIIEYGLDDDQLMYAKELAAYLAGIDI